MRDAHLALNVTRADDLSFVQRQATEALQRGTRVIVFTTEGSSKVRVFRALPRGKSFLVAGHLRAIERRTAAEALSLSLSGLDAARNKASPVRFAGQAASGNHDHDHDRRRYACIAPG